MIPPSDGSRVGGFGGEEFGAVAGGTAGEVVDDEGGADKAVAEGINGLDCGMGFFAAGKAGDAVCDGGFEILGPGERCSAGESAAGRLAGIVEGTAAETEL